MWSVEEPGDMYWGWMRSGDERCWFGHPRIWHSLLQQPNGGWWRRFGGVTPPAVG